MCQYGQGIVRSLFEEFGDAPMQGLVAWVPILAGDDRSAADAEAAAFDDERLRHAWDGERHLSDAYAPVLGLSCPAWDVYLLYRPGAEWGDQPPEPIFWMLQLPERVGADPSRLLDASRFAVELQGLLPFESKHGDDLALRLHSKALAIVQADRSGKRSGRG